MFGKKAAAASEPEPDPENAENADTTSTADMQANCPVCRVGVVRRRFTTCGLLWVICFPFGIICCFLLSSKQCDKCGYNEGL